MLRLRHLKPISPTLLFAVVACTLFSCDWLRSSTCGHNNTVQIIADADAATNPRHPLDSPALLTNEVTSDGQRHYVWSTFINSACADELVSVTGISNVINGSRPVEMIAHESHALLFETHFEVMRDNDGSSTSFTLDGEFSLKEAFPDGPGSFQIFLEVFFPSSGIPADDEQYARDHLRRIVMNANFFDPAN